MCDGAAAAGNGDGVVSGAIVYIGSCSETGAPPGAGLANQGDGQKSPGGISPQAGEGGSADRGGIPPERMRKQELPMNVPIRLAPGKYILRLGVRDNLTGLFGTADLALEVPAKRESKR